MTDRLTLAHALEEGGILREAAEHIATEIFGAIHSNVATKTDLRELEQKFEIRFEETQHLITRMTIALGAIVIAAAGILHYWK